MLQSKLYGGLCPNVYCDPKLPLYYLHVKIGEMGHSPPPQVVSVFYLCGMILKLLH